MASTVLSTVQRHQLSHLPRDIPEADLGRYFTLSAADLELIRQRRSPHNQLGFALQLCTLRYVGFVPEDLNDPPHIIANLLADQLGLFADTVAAYPQRKQTKSEHLASVMVYLGFRRATAGDLQI
jgi:TnpA family transposase